MITIILMLVVLAIAVYEVYKHGYRKGSEDTINRMKKVRIKK